MAKAFKEKLKILENLGASRACDLICRLTLYLLVFLTPLFFLPWTPNILDFNKQLLAGILVFVALVSWLFKRLVLGKMNFDWSRPLLLALGLLIVYRLSTFFSLWPEGSLWGQPLPVAQSFVSLLIFVVTFFLIVNVFKKEEVSNLLMVIIASGLGVAVIGLLQIFGKFLFPWEFARRASFNTIGALSSMAVFLSCLLPLIIVLVQEFNKKSKKIFLSVAGVMILLTLFMVNFWVSFVLLILGSAALFILGSVNLKKGQNMGWLLLPMILLIIGVLFLTLQIDLVQIPGQVEVSLVQKTEIDIARGSLAEHPVLGSGPGTLAYSFSKFKPEQLAESPFWNIRFSKGASEFLDKLITSGVLGIIFWLGVIISGIWIGIKNSISRPTLLNFGVFSGFLGTVGLQFLYPADFSTIFLFWLMLGIILSQKTSKEKRFFKKNCPRLKRFKQKILAQKVLVTSLVLVVTLILGAYFVFNGAQKYIAEMSFKEGMEDWNQGNSEQAITHITRATELNSQSDTYYRTLGQIYLEKLNKFLQTSSLETQENLSRAQALMVSSVNAAQGSTRVNPENVANWNVRGFIYRNLIGVLEGAESWAQKMYNKAKQLEPANPYIYTELGRVHLAKSDILPQNQQSQKNELLIKALQEFEKALEIKPDYAPARYQLALVYDRQGNIEEAIKEMQEAQQISPMDPGLAFQLGVLFWREEELGPAQLQLERAVELNKNYSNARYFLGLVYDKKGEKQKAIEQFERILELNPESKQVKKILANLKAGKEALEGLGPAQPVKETPQEIEKK